MQVETKVIEALDSGLRMFMSYLPLLPNQPDHEREGSVRSFILQLLAVRHFYLGSHVYTKC